MRIQPRHAALPIVLALLLTACSSAAPADENGGADTAATATTYADACEAGQDEGPVDWWTQDPATAETTIELFEEAHPEIEVTFTQLLENDIAQRIVAESNAGRGVTADVVVGHLAAFQPLVDRELIDTEIQWPEEVDEGLVTPSNMVRVHRRVSGLVYNTNEVSAEELPDTWEELVDPKWRGMVSVHSTGIPFNILAVEWGEEKTLEWVQQMKDVVEPEVINGTTASIQAAASGEVPIAASGRDSEMKEQRASGAPVDIKYLEPVPTFDFHQAIPAGAEDPNAALCFATWYVGEGAEDVLPLSFSTNVDQPEDLPEGATVIAVEPEDVEVLDSSATAIAELWGGTE